MTHTHTHTHTNNKMNNKPMVCMGTVYCVYIKIKIFNIIALSDGMIDVSGFENFIA